MVKHIADMIELAERRRKRARQRVEAAQAEEGEAIEALAQWRGAMKQEVSQ